MKQLLIMIFVFTTTLFAFEEIDATSITKKVKDKNVIIDFYADWCPPCKIVSRQLEKLEQNYSNDVIIYKIDIDKNREILSKYNISSIPTLIYFKKGEVVYKQVGVVDAKTMNNNIKKYIY